MTQLNITPVVDTQNDRLNASLRWAEKLDARGPDKLPQGVYLFECEGYYKVGIASDPRKRLWTAQTGCPFEIRLLAFRLMTDAKDTERLIHHQLEREGCHVRGEWFKLTPALLAKLLNILAP